MTDICFVDTDRLRERNSCNHEFPLYRINDFCDAIPIGQSSDFCAHPLTSDGIPDWQRRSHGFEGKGPFRYYMKA